MLVWLKGALLVKVVADLLGRPAALAQQTHDGGAHAGGELARPARNTLTDECSGLRLIDAVAPLVAIACELAADRASAAPESCCDLLLSYALLQQGVNLAPVRVPQATITRHDSPKVNPRSYRPASYPAQTKLCTG